MIATQAIRHLPPTWTWRKLAAVLMVSGAALCLGSMARAAEDCSLRQLASMPMSGDSHQAVVLNATIAGKPVRLLVDTGGVYSVLFSDVAAALQLEHHPIRNGLSVFDANGVVSKEYVTVHDLVVDTARLAELSMMIKDRGEDKLPIDGILAPDFLAHFDLDFDFAARKLNFISPFHCEGQVVYWTKTPYAALPFRLDGTHIIVPVTLDGRELPALLDTGSPVTFMEESESRIQFGVDATSPGAALVKDASSDRFDRFQYRFKTLAMSGVTVTNPLIHIFHDRAADSARKEEGESVAMPIYSEHLASPKLIVGMDVLSNLHLYVSYKEKQLFMTGANVH